MPKSQYRCSRLAACWLAIGLAGCAKPAAVVESEPPQSAAAIADSTSAVEPVHRSPGHVEVVSERCQLDRPYLAALGPRSSVDFRLLDAEPGELMWITGAHVRVVDGDRGGPAPQSYLWRTELTWDRDRHRANFPAWRQRSTCALALTAGQADLVFPAGSGIPVWSDEPLVLTTQWVNLDFSSGQKPVQLRAIVTFDVTRQRDLPEPLQPLYLCTLPALASLESGAAVYDAADELLGPDLKAMASAPAAAFLIGSERTDSFARRYADYWVLAPGRQVVHTRVTTLLDLESDANVAAFAFQSSRRAESIALVDRTTGIVILPPTAGAEETAPRPEGSPARGIVLPAGHEYELVSVFDNRTAEPQGALARLDLYLVDPQMVLPTNPPAAER